MKIVVTGGEPFEAAAVCRVFRAEHDARVVYLDGLGTADLADAFGDLLSRAKFASFGVEQGETAAVADILRFEQPDAIVELAAPASQTAALLDAVQSFWSELPKGRKDAFRFVHAWAAAHANAAGHGAAERIIAARHAAVGFPAVSVRCAVTYGPFQSPLAPLPIWLTNAILGRELTLANLGLARTPWVYVDDLARGLVQAVKVGVPGRRYVLAPKTDASDLEAVHRLCEILDANAPRSDAAPHALSIKLEGGTIVASPEASLAAVELPPVPGWSAEVSLSAGLAVTSAWYLANSACWLPQRLAALNPSSEAKTSAPQAGREAAA